MQPITKGFLFLSSLLNAAICFFSFWFVVFATGPHMNDVTMRIGFYVVTLITISALAAVFVPWLLAYRKRNNGAVFIAALPVLLTFSAVFAFLTLDGWLNRTFSSTDSVRYVVASLL